MVLHIQNNTHQFLLHRRAWSGQAQAQTVSHFFLPILFPIPLRQWESVTVETSLAVQGQPTTHFKVQFILRKEQSLNLVLKKYHLHTELNDTAWLFFRIVLALNGIV